MNLEQYAAQQAQQAPQAQEPQQANQLDAVAARIDAEKLSSLMAETRQAIDEYRSPATLLTVITGAMFGEGSAEAAAVAETIAADRHPGGRELAIAGLRQRRKMLNQMQKQLAGQQKTIAAEIEHTIAEERELTEPQQDTALLEVLTAQKPDLKEAADLYQKHHGNPAAMGLLYGKLSAQPPELDLMQQAEFMQLKEKVLKAAAGNPQN